jgi:WD40-like Beta Propeller Repeat
VRPVGSVGTVGFGREGARLAIDLAGRVTRAGDYPDSRRRVVVSPNGRWRAVLGLPGTSGATATVAIGPNRAGGSLRIVERHLYAGTADVQWSPDSRWLVMSVHVPHLLSAVAVSTDGRRRVLAAPFCGDFASGVAWAPHGDLVALGVPAPGTGCRSGIELRVRRADGGRGRVIARGISGVPSWSADGRWLATSGSTVEVMRSDGSDRRVVGYGLAAWSTRSELLAVTSSQAQTLSVGTPTGRREIWDGPVNAGFLPAFSPDGRLLAYVRSDAIVVRRVADRRLLTRVPIGGGAQIYELAWAAGSRSLRADALAVAAD